MKKKKSCLIQKQVNYCTPKHSHIIFKQLNSLKPRERLAPRLAPCKTIGFGQDIGKGVGLYVVRPGCHGNAERAQTISVSQPQLPVA